MNCIWTTYETVFAKLVFRAKYGIARYRAINDPAVLDLDSMRSDIKTVVNDYCKNRTAFGIGSYIYEIRGRLSTLRRAFPQYFSEISFLHQSLSAFDTRGAIVHNIDNVIQDCDDPFLLFLFLQAVEKSRR